MTDRPLSSTERLMLVLVEPQPDYIQSSGRWHWPLPERARFPGCSTSIVTASREWWEYAPSEAKPHPMAEGVQMRDDKWYWAIPANDERLRIDAMRYRFLRRPETEMGPRAEDAFAVMWRAISLKGCWADQMDAAIDRGMEDFRKAQEEDENPSAHVAAGVTGHD